MRTRSSLVALASALLVALCVAVPAMADTPPPAQVVAFLNQERAANGLPADVAENPVWDTDCALHETYMQLNGYFGHSEDSSLPGWTAGGAFAGSNAVLVSAGTPYSSSGVNAFAAAPIDLMELMSPWMLTTGTSGGCLFTIGDISRSFGSVATFSYPGDGGVVDPSERANEQPFVPGDFVGLPLGTTTGPQLFFYAVQPGGYAASKGHITSATLTGPAGPVDVRTIDNDTPASGSLPAPGDYFPGGGILVPAAPLVPGSSYTASVTFAFNGSPDAPISRTWSFTTRGTAPAPAPAPIARAPIQPGPVPKLSKVHLGKHSFELRSTTSDMLFVAVSARQHHAWKVRRSFTVKPVAGHIKHVKVARLTHGDYLVTVRSTLALGAVVFSHRFRVS